MTTPHQDIEGLHADVDRRALDLARVHAERLNCEAGCADCCSDGLTIFEVEAERIRESVGTTLEGATARAPGGCAFLDVEDRCRVYAARPYVCRTQGLPLRWTADADDGGWVECRDICPKNEEGPALETLNKESCWTLGPTEASLRQLQEGGSPGARIALRDLFAQLAALGLLFVLAIGTLGAQAPVRNGIDVLLAEGFKRLEGRKIGLITNHTGLDHAGRSIVDHFSAAKKLRLVSLMSPEHGFGGTQEGKVASEKHERTGLTIHSLYGETRKPTDAMLDGVDTLVFDIQDIGARFYTYISTMLHAMEEASQREIAFVVLDRPNPIDGVHVQGPVLDPGRETFVSCFPLPVRHGMTVGELALLFRAELKMKLKLEVVRIEGWRRTMLLDETGQEWRNPSPNMRCLTQALLYPGVGLLETTNLSVGRGTDTPFEMIGAPWMKHFEVARRLNAARLPGVRFIARRFTPTTSKFEKQLCNGINIQITDRSRFDPLLCGLTMARVLVDLHPDAWKVKGYRRLLGHESTFKGLLSGKRPEELIASWQPGLRRFLALRRRHLLY